MKYTCLVSSYADAILHDTGETEILVTGGVIISASPSFSNLTLAMGKTLHGVDIGDCASPNILLKSGSCVAASQSITGPIIFNLDDAKKDLSLTKVSLSPGAQVSCYQSVIQDVKAVTLPG